jgi:hypothetical protein
VGVSARQGTHMISLLTAAIHPHPRSLPTRGRGAIPYSLLPIPYSLFPTPHPLTYYSYRYIFFLKGAWWLAGIRGRARPTGFMRGEGAVRKGPGERASRKSRRPSSVSRPVLQVPPLPAAVKRSAGSAPSSARGVPPSEAPAAGQDRLALPPDDRRSSGARRSWRARQCGAAVRAGDGNRPGGRPSGRPAQMPPCGAGDGRITHKDHARLRRLRTVPFALSASSPRHICPRGRWRVPPLARLSRLHQGAIAWTAFP